MHQIGTIEHVRSKARYKRMMHQWNRDIYLDTESSQGRNSLRECDVHAGTNDAVLAFRVLAADLGTLTSSNMDSRAHSIIVHAL